MHDCFTATDFVSYKLTFIIEKCVDLERLYILAHLGKESKDIN